MNKTVILTRGTSGVGKSTYANFLNLLAFDAAKTCVICTADDFFEQDGQYKFDASLLGQAHYECKDKFIQALARRVDLIIVANTSTKLEDFEFYLDRAKTFGYQIFVMVLENYHSGINVHGVPDETLLRQENNIKNSLKLR